MRKNDLTKMSKAISQLIEVHDTLLNDLESNSRLFSDARGCKKHSDLPERIISLKQDGLKNAHIAKELEVSPQYVGQILRRQAEDVQSDFFKKGSNHNNLVTSLKKINGKIF